MSTLPKLIFFFKESPSHPMLDLRDVEGERDNEMNKV